MCVSKTLLLITQQNAALQTSSDVHTASEDFYRRVPGSHVLQQKKKRNKIIKP